MLFLIATLSEIKHWFLPCFQQDPLSSSAVFTSLLNCMDFSSYSILKGLIFISNFHFVYITSCEKSHFLHVFVLIQGLVLVQSQILLNLQLVPSILNGYPILCIAMYSLYHSVYKVFITLMSKFLIYQGIESSSKNFFILLCYSTMLYKTFSHQHIQQPRISWFKRDASLQPSTGCIAEL